MMVPTWSLMNSVSRVKNREAVQKGVKVFNIDLTTDIKVRNQVISTI